jgi:hypothetical protein
MSQTIVKPSTLDTSLIHFSEPITNAKGGKSVDVSYSDESKFYIRTPDIKIAFDCKDASIDNPNPVGYPKYEFQLSFEKLEDPRLKSFHTMINSFDDLLTETASKNSLSWLKMKTAPVAVVEALVNRTIKQSKDPKTQEPNGLYPDTMRVRVPVGKEGKLLCQFYDKDKNDITDMSVIGKLRRGTVVQMILECSGIYFSNGKFGFTAWKIFQCSIVKESTSGIPRGRCLITDSDDDEEITHKQDTKPLASVNFAQSTDKDELDGSNDEEVQPVLEVKPSVKKVVKKAPSSTLAAKK